MLLQPQAGQSHPPCLCTRAPERTPWRVLGLDLGPTPDRVDWPWILNFGLSTLAPIFPLLLLQLLNLILHLLFPKLRLPGYALLDHDEREV